MGWNRVDVHGQPPEGASVKIAGALYTVGPASLSDYAPDTLWLPPGALVLPEPDDINPPPLPGVWMPMRDLIDDHRPVLIAYDHGGVGLVGGTERDDDKQRGRIAWRELPPHPFKGAE